MGVSFQNCNYIAATNIKDANYSRHTRSLKVSKYLPTELPRKYNANNRDDFKINDTGTYLFFLLLVLFVSNFILRKYY